MKLDVMGVSNSPMLLVFLSVTFCWSTPLLCSSLLAVFTLLFFLDFSAAAAAFLAADSLSFLEFFFPPRVSEAEELKEPESKSCSFFSWRSFISA